MNCLILGWSIGSGSTGVYASELAQHLCGAGHRVTCLSAGGSDWRLRPHLALRQQHPFGIIDLRNPPIVPCTRPADPRNEIDSPETLTLLSSRRHAFAAAISQADCVCYISRRTRDLAEQFGVACSRSMIAPVRLSHIHCLHAASAAHRRKRPQSGDRIRFGYLGAHSPEKGIEVLLAAFGGLSRTNATLSCHGGGGAAYMAELKRIAARHAQISFHGRYEQGQLASILQNIEVGIVPSICEDTAPNTVLEFQAAGIPVIGSDVGGIPEQIESGRNGALFTPGNAAALRQCMQRVLDEPQIIAHWAENLPNSFDPLPSWRQIEQVLCDLAGDRMQKT